MSAHKAHPRQVYLIARRALEMLDLPYPEDRSDADALIRRLNAALEDMGGAQTGARSDDCPF